MDFSAGSIMASLFVSTIGMGLFLYGKREVRTPQLVVGLVLMVFPYVVPSPMAMLSIGGALVLGLFGALRAGM